MERCLGCMNEYDEVYDVCPYCGYIKGTAAKSRNHLEPGTILIDRYLIGRCLGQGGFGITYIAWDTRLYKKVAIKEFMPTSLASRITGELDITCYNEEAQGLFQNGIRRMLDESRRLARFNDLESVVKVYDCLEANHTAYIIMELLDGENIKNILTEKGSYNVAQTVQIMLPVLQALREIHAAGLIHRDISPDNIFVCNNGKVKILDFGSARVASGDDEKSLSVILKPGYAPKEQYSSSTEQGPFTDIYAVCATIYKMLTGKTPIDSLERRVKADSLTPIGELVDMPDKLSHIIMRGLAIEPEDRLQTVDPLLDVFQKMDLSAPPAPSKKKKSHKEKQPRKNPPVKKAGKKPWLPVVLICAAVLLVGGAVFGIVRVAQNRTPTLDVDADVSEEYTPYQQELLAAASQEDLPVRELPDVENFEMLPFENQYSTEDDALYADYTDENGMLLMRVKKDRANDVFVNNYTLYDYNDDGQISSSVEVSDGDAICKAERYFYNKDGTLFAKSEYDDMSLTQMTVYTVYDSSDRPVEGFIRYGNSSEETMRFSYEEGAQFETHYDAEGNTVYESIRYEDDGEVKEKWYTQDGKVSKEIVREYTDAGIVEQTVKVFDRMDEKQTWLYGDSGKLKEHFVYDKDNAQTAGYVFKYVKGKLRYIECQTVEGEKTYLSDLKTGGYFLYTFEDGNMLERMEYDVQDELVSRICMDYDDEGNRTRTEYYDENAELVRYCADYTYEDAQTYSYSEYDAEGRKQADYSFYGEEKYVTSYDKKERVLLESSYEGDSCLWTEEYVYSGAYLDKRTFTRYDAETGEQTVRYVHTYYADDTENPTCRTDTTYDKNNVIRLYLEYNENGAERNLRLYNKKGSLTDEYIRESTLLGIEYVRHADGNGNFIERIDINNMDWYPSIPE
ncbi:MAG: serine/threonine protein kinase [Acutalibacteraceae bacterium]